MPGINRLPHLFALLLLVCGANTPLASATPFEDGNKRYEQGEFEKALAEYDKAVADLENQTNPAADTDALLKRYPKAVVASFDGNPKVVTEMDALVAYLQMLGTLVDFSTYDDASGYR